jgi:gas vesicle protein
MDNQGDKVGSGFLAGTIFGGVVGGLVGAWLAKKLSDTLPEEDPTAAGENAKNGAKTISAKTINNRASKRQPLRGGDELNIESARQGLETKIAQLNDAIDDVRNQLSNVRQD